MKMLKIIGISIAVLYLGFCGVLVAVWVHGVRRPPKSGEDVASVDWLPAEATGINYYRSYGFTAYEFQISETGFRVWAANAAYKPSSEYVFYQPVAEVVDLKEKYSFPIKRYNSIQWMSQDLPKGSDYSQLRRATSIEIEDGLWGQMRRGSAGGYSIGYDRKTGTAYWQSNPR